MPSPAKKRKLNGDSKSSLPSRGLEYFFAKQRDRNGASSSLKNENEPVEDVAHRTDEELARKLQAEWDREEAGVPAAEREAMALNGKKLGASPMVPRNIQPYKDEIGGDRTPSEPPKPSTAEPSGKEKGKGKGTGTLSLQSAAASVDIVSESIPLDESPLTFDPDKYVPQLREHWAKDGGNASYALLTRCFVLVSGTSSRIKIVDTLVNCLRILIAEDPESLLPAVSHKCHEHFNRHLLPSLLLLHTQAFAQLTPSTQND